MRLTCGTHVATIMCMPRVRLCPAADVPPGEGREFPVGDRLIALFRLAEPGGSEENGGGEWFALDGLCPHAGGPLGAGCLIGTTVTCPWHGWQFDVTTGTHALTPQVRAERFPVVVEAGAVFVTLPD